MPESKISVEKYDPNMRAAKKKDSGLAWYSPKDKPFDISGFPWIESEGKYRRLPVSPPEPIPEAVDFLADYTAGGQIRFRTDSPNMSIRARLSGPANMVHMPATGQCGFDCYISEEGEPGFCGTTKYDYKESEYECTLFELDSAMRNVVLNFPLYQGVEEVRIGLAENAAVEAPLPFADPRPLIFYGTSITQGGCASRPGTAYTNILSRKLNRECINLGFSGSGKGEEEMARLIASIPYPGALVLDYEANCVSTLLYRETLPRFIEIFREFHPEIPVILISRIVFAMEKFSKAAANEREVRFSFQKQLIRDLRNNGDGNIYFIDGTSLLGKHCQDATVDGIHPTDLGFMDMAENLYTRLSSIPGL